ncbi:MAG: endolytic transglycosylase MltG [Bacteroidota bacterium]
MKRILRWSFWVLLLSAIFFYWVFASTTTSFKERSRYLVIEDKQSKNSILETLQANNMLRFPWALSILGSTMGLWDKIKPGKYEINKGDNILSIARMLKNGRQAEVKLVINRLRLKEDLAKLIGKNISVDSASVMRFLNAPDSLKEFQVDTQQVFTLIIPDTYVFYWNTPLRKIFRKLADNKNLFWKNKERAIKAHRLGLSEEDVYTLASIVDEETNYESDKYKIASVYLNRLNAGMPLQACPTIKYAMKDFTLTRIYEKYLFNPSPYNTYRKKGLPPGPICTPSPKTIDIVLDAPATRYLYFVAKSDFSGYHHFSSDFSEHSHYAREYQTALDAYTKRKQEKNQQP